MNIHLEKDPVQNLWWVHMDRWVASFRSLAAAESFVERLSSRINAPHSLGATGNNSLSPGTFSNSQPLDQHAVSGSVKTLYHA
ncbi:MULTISPECIES: hypothetical protein [Pseudomonas]|jgi:hypothetical protein|uniref:hypothetical protein n=1 Tax=Pseudomonas TaxID=286 RepID=UPI0009CD3FC4|nr:hypothetical protein [Pseudomonas sp. VI4.1]OPK07543.1 hypothetical protein BZ163_26385 [Pseudomonas sp. VI4.1]